jgi:hypothetical protein
MEHLWLIKEKSMKSKSLFILLGLAAFASFTGYLLGIENALITTVKAQNAEKIVELAPTINQQLRFSKVKVNQQPVEFGKYFEADVNWIENLTFNLENISDKPIVYLQFNIKFPETITTGLLMSYGKSFGQRPDSKFKSKNEPILIKPGETLEVSLDKEEGRIYKFVNERQPIETIHKIELEIALIIFEDKTAWSSGTFLRQDPNNPDRYNPIESEPQQ